MCIALYGVHSPKNRTGFNCCGHGVAVVCIGVYIQVDPDFLTGYNCINFDLCYLLTRAAALKAEGVYSLSRLKAFESRISDTRFSSRCISGKRLNAKP